MMATRMISKPEWRSFFDRITTGLTERRAEVEIASLRLGSQIQAEWIPLLGITYDPKNDLLEVVFEGLDHLIRNPIEIYVQEGDSGLESLSVLDNDGNRQIIRLKQAVIL